MTPKIVVMEGWIEVEINDNCQYAKFEEAANTLIEQFQVRFVEKLDDPDNSYWGFIYKDCLLTLQFNHYCGISLSPTRFGQSTSRDNECAKEIGILLFDRLNNIA